MLYYVITILLLVIIICYYSKVYEPFYNYKIKFVNGLEPKGVIKSPSEFEIVTIDNPGDTKDVLRQNKFSKESYDISINGEKNSSYAIIYWRTNDSLYNGSNDDISIINSKGEKINFTRKELLDTKTVKDLVWEQIRLIFNIKNPKFIIQLGNIDPFTKGVRYFADIEANKYIDKLPDFNFQNNNLKTLVFFNKKYRNKSLSWDNMVGLNSHAITHNVNKIRTPILNNDSVKLTGTVFKLDKASKLLDKDTFTIIFSYTPNKGEKGSIINLEANNIINKGINIEINTTLTNYNEMYINILNKKYTYRLGLINKPTVYMILGNLTGRHQLLIDNIRQRHHKYKKQKMNQMGTCPNGWMYNGKRCIQFKTNGGRCRRKSIPVNMKTTSRAKRWWSRRCRIRWTNCKKLKKGDIAPNNSDSCKSSDLKLNFSDRKVLINKNRTLNGNLHNLLIYNTSNHPKGSIENLYKYIMLRIVEPDIRDYMSRPSLLEKKYNVLHESDNVLHESDNVLHESEYTLTESHNLLQKSNTKCPFDNKSICENTYCNTVCWSDINKLNKINRECKEVVNDYCADNYEDQFCNKLRDKKCKKNGQECNSCYNNVDLLNYISKIKSNNFKV